MRLGELVPSDSLEQAAACCLSNGCFFLVAVCHTHIHIIIANKYASCRKFPSAQQRIVIKAVARSFVRGGDLFPSPFPSLPLPSIFSHFPLPPSLPSPFPSPSLRSRTPQIQLGGLGSAVSSPRGLGQPKSNLVHFSLKIWHLVATV